MKVQKLITDILENNFNREVNKHLADGWMVVPGTLIASVAITDCGSSNYLSTQKEMVFAVVLEKD